MTDALVDHHAKGLAILERIDAEYFATRASNPSVGDYERALMGWRGLATAWIVDTEELLAGDPAAVASFRAATAPASAPAGHSVAWGGIRGGREVKLEALRRIIERRRADPSGWAGPGRAGSPPGARELVALLKPLVEKVRATALSEVEKDDATELARALALEASRPGALSAVGRATAAALGQIVTRAPELVPLWQAIVPHVRR